MLGDEPRLKRPLAVARDVNRQRAVVGQHRLATRPIPMIGGGLRLGAAWRVPEVVRELAAQGALDDGLLEAPDRGVELLVG